jgi:hypothetical protein
MRWLRLIVLDIVILVIIYLATIGEQQWARWFILFYTPLVVVMRILALRSRLLQRKVEAGDEVPVWAYHLIYAASFSLCIWDQWWLVAVGWGAIWIMSSIYQSQMSGKGDGSKTKEGKKRVR